MSQRMTARRRLHEGGGLDPIDLSTREEYPTSWISLLRQCLACVSATLTMVVVGTINGWTTITLYYLISGTGGAPLILTHDESSWMVSLTILGTMIGSLVAAPLADMGGRIYCLIACSIMFIVGWFTIYVAITVSILYLARVILGIGVGIAYVTNPMYVSEIADINFRGSLCTLIAVNVYVGSLVTCYIGMWLTYKSLLVFLIIISFISFLSNMCFPETPYFLVAKGQKKQACKSIAYYKDIVDPKRVKFELRALRAEVRYELHQQSRSDLPVQSRRALPRQSRSNLPSHSRSELPPQSRSDLPSQSRSDLPPQSRSNLPSHSRSELPTQSTREAHSGSFWEVVDTEHMSDLHLPSSSDSQSISVVHSEVICEVHQQPTGELRLKPSRDSLELPLKSSRELPSQSTSKIHRSSTSELHRPSIRKIHRSSTSEIHQPSTSKIHPERISTIHPESTSEVHQPSTSEIHPEPTSAIHPESTSEVHQPSTSEIHPEPTSAIHPESTNEIHELSTSEIHPEPTSAIHPESTREIHPESTNEIRPDIISEIHSTSSSDLRAQFIADSRESSDIDEIYMDEIKYTYLTKLKVIVHGSHRKALFIMLGLIMAQQLSGNFITTQYLEVLFNKTAIDSDPYEATTLVQLVSLVAGTLTVIMVQYIGRRKLLILSTVGSCVTLSILATYFWLVEHNSDVSNISFVPLVDLLIYQVVFQIGLGTLTNVLLCELFPTELRGFVAAIIVIFDGLIGFIVSKLYQVITDNVGSYAIYYIFTISSFLAFLMMYLWIPETKGKSYHEIEALLVGKNLNSLNEEVRI